jgi:hypothetical protein
MCRVLRIALASSAFLLFAAAGVHAAEAKAGTLVCVGLYSETSDGSVSYRVGGGDWIVVKVEDAIPANAEIRVNVDRDWIELIAAGKPNAVYEIHGPDTGEVIKKAADILKGKPRLVSFPKGTASSPDPKFKNKLVVGKYLGRQVYTSPDGDEKDIKYGDVLAGQGKVRIIAINNTIELYLANGKFTKVIGPLNFDLEKVLTGQKLYKYLNAP